MIVKRNAFSLQMREMLDSLLKKTVRKKKVTGSVFGNIKQYTCVFRGQALNLQN